MLPRHTAQTPLPPTRSVAGCSQSDLSVHTGTCSPYPLAPCGHRSRTLAGAGHLMAGGAQRRGRQRLRWPELGAPHPESEGLAAGG